METKISAKQLEITTAIEEYAMKKVDRFPRYFDRISSVEVILESTKIGFSIEIITVVEHHDPFIATAESEDLYACIDLGADKTIRQLTDHKSRLRDNKHHAKPPTSMTGNEA